MKLEILDELERLERDATPKWERVAYAEADLGLTVILTGGEKGKQAETNSLLACILRNNAKALIECARTLEWYEQNANDLYGMDLDRGQCAREA